MVRHIIINPSLEKIDGDLKKTSPNEFIDMIASAYALHRIPTISPDDVWILILNYIAKNVNENENHYRPHLADKNNPDGKSVIEIMRNVYLPESPEFIDGLFSEFVAKMSEKSIPLISQLTADFSTTTTLTRLCSQISIAHLMEKYFSMRMIMMCGFPGIDLAGTVEDWENLKKKISSFNQIAHQSLQDYLAKCQDVMDKFINPESADWNNFFYKTNCGSGHDEAYDGWILDLLNMKISDSWLPSEVPSSRTSYQFELVELSGKKTDLVINSGPFVNQDSTLGYDYKIEIHKTRYQIMNSDNFPENIDFNDIVWNMENFSKMTFDGKPLADYLYYSKKSGSKILYNPETKKMIVTAPYKIRNKTYTGDGAVVFGDTYFQDSGMFGSGFQNIDYSSWVILSENTSPKSTESDSESDSKSTSFDSD